MGFSALGVMGINMAVHWPQKSIPQQRQVLREAAMRGLRNFSPQDEVDVKSSHLFVLQSKGPSI